MDHQLLLTKLINSDFYLPTVLIAGYLTGVFALPLAVLVWEKLTDLSGKVRNLFAKREFTSTSTSTPLVNVVEVHLHLGEDKVTAVASESSASDDNATESLDRTSDETPSVDLTSSESSASDSTSTDLDSEIEQVQQVCFIPQEPVEIVQTDETPKVESEQESEVEPIFAADPETSKSVSIEELMAERAKVIENTRNQNSQNPSYAGLIRFLESRKAIKSGETPSFDRPVLKSKENLLPN